MSLLNPVPLTVKVCCCDAIPKQVENELILLELTVITGTRVHSENKLFEKLIEIISFLFLAVMTFTNNKK